MNLNSALSRKVLVLTILSGMPAIAWQSSMAEKVTGKRYAPARKVLQKAPARVRMAKPSAREMNAIFDKILSKRFATGDDARDYRTLTHREKVWYDVWTFSTLIDLDGFIGYFDSTAGEDIQWLLDSLKAIGALRTREALVKLCKVFPNGRPSSHAHTRKKQVAKLKEADFVWTANYGEDLELLVWKYWVRHGSDAPNLSFKIARHLKIGRK